MRNRFLNMGEYAGAGLYEEPRRSLFYRKALALRRYYENCEVPKYSGEYLYPSGMPCDKMKLVPDYFIGLTFPEKDSTDFEPDIVEKLCKDFRKYSSSIPIEHTVAGDMYTHSMPNYPRILKEGLYSYQPRIEMIKDKDMREGLLHVLAGIERYIERSIEYLISVSANSELINALKKVPLYPATNVYEAIVSWNFIMYLDNCDNIGCIEEGLLPYFKGENILPYIENLYSNIDACGGYSASLNCKNPDLTVQLLKGAMGKRRPMLELLITDDTPDVIWQTAFKVIRSGGGQPAFYNKTVLLDGLKKRFPSIKEEDLDTFCGGGCTESMFTGLSHVGSIDAGINLLLIFENALHEKIETVQSFDEFYSYYIQEVKKVVKTVKREISISRKNRAKYNPVPMRTLLIDDCIDKESDYNAYGARYNFSIINFAGIINTIDSLLAIKTLVFDQKKYCGREVLSFLKNNDEGFLKEVTTLEYSYGKDNPFVNKFARKFSKTIFSTTKSGKPHFGEGFLSASIQFKSQDVAGAGIGATPDGRRAGEPLCDSLGAIFGKDTFGPTALLNSVTALDLSSALGVPVLNFNINEKMKDEILKSLILGYIKKGGIQLQITYANKEELLDAYAHPERHGNLIVRVGGYSDYFNNLSDELKKMIINRTIQIWKE